MAETAVDSQKADLGSTTDSDVTKDPTTKESSETSTEEPQSTPADFEENCSVTSDKPGIDVPEQSALNGKSNLYNMPIDEQAKERECDSKNMLKEDLNRTFDSDCEIIADPVNMVDLTDDDSMIQEASHPNIEDNPNNSVDLTEGSAEHEIPSSQVEPEKGKENETSSINSDQTKTDGIISVAESGQIETSTVQSNHEVAPETEIQNIEEDVSMEESNATEASNNQQSNSEAGTEKLDRVESNDNENLKDQVAQGIHTADQDKSREDQSYLEVPEMAYQLDIPMEESNANQSSSNEPNNSEVETEKSNEEPKENETLEDRMSVDNSPVNETNTNESSTAVVDLSTEDLEMVNQNAVVDLSLEDSNENESSNNAESVAANSAPKTKLNTSISNSENNKPKKCYKCQEWGHVAIECPKSKKNSKATKRVGEEVTEAPVAKKNKSWPKLPLDLPAFICQKQENPKVNKFLKLKMIKECSVLYLNPIPKEWKHNEMNSFMVQNTRCITENDRHCFYIFVRDDDSNSTGECLVKFRSSLFCQTSWFDLQGTTIDNSPMTIELDLGHEKMRQVRKDNKVKVKQLLCPDSQEKEEPKKNVYKFIKEKHDEMMQQKTQTDTKVASVEESSVASNSKKKKTDGAGPSCGPQNSKGPASGPQNNDLSTLSAVIQKLRTTKAREKRLSANEQVNLLALRERKQVSRFMMPDSPNKRRKRKSSPIRIPCPLKPGTPEKPPPRKPQAWEDPTLEVVYPEMDGLTTATSHREASSNDDCIIISPVPIEKRAYMPKEQFGNTTYGLNEAFLKSLGLKVPLSNVLIVIGVDVALNEDRIKEVFSLAGVVKRQLRVLKKDGTPTWRVMVEYDHPVEAVQAISMFQGKNLNNSEFRLKMVPPFPRPLPLGLTEIGPGLGHEGEPMRGVRSLIELQALKKMLTDFKTLFDNKVKEIEKAIADIPKAPIVCETDVPKKTPTPVSKSQAPQSQASQSQTSQNQPAQSQSSQSQSTQSQSTDAATQLVNALSSLAQPNVLMGLSTLLNAQGLVQPGMVQPGVVQPGMGADQAAMAMQNQMMMQNAAFAQNFNMPQGMAPPLPGYPHPEMVRPQMMPPMDQPQMVPQPYYQNQMVQPGFVPIQPVPPPDPVAPPAKPPQPIPPPPPVFTKQTPKPAPQQTPAYTPRVPQPGQNPAPPKDQPRNSNWREVAPLAAKKQRTAEPPKPAYSSPPQPRPYIRPSRFDVKEKPNLKVIEPVPEQQQPQQKNDMLVFTNLPSSVTVNALNSKMREVGDVVFSEITGRGRALVRFKFPRDAERCIKLFNRSKVDGQVINVEFF